MNHKKKKVRLNLYLSKQEWAHLEKETKGNVYAFLKQEASLFWQLHAPQLQPIIEACTATEEEADRAGGKVGMRISLPPPIGDFYQKLSKIFGVEAATFFVRYVLTPHLTANPKQNVLNNAAYYKRRKPAAGTSYDKRRRITK